MTLLRILVWSFLAVSLVGCQTVRSVPPTAAAKTPTGYAFDQPRVLTQQIIWGIGHGVRLLAEACQRRGDVSADATYRAWYDAQQVRLQSARLDLSRHYFASDQATAAELDKALKLSPALKQRDDELGPACATFAQALSKPHYDLEKRYAADRAAILKGDPAFPGAVWDEDEKAAAPAASSQLAPPDAQGNNDDAFTP